MELLENEARRIGKRADYYGTTEQTATEKAEKAARDARRNARTAVEKKPELAGGLDAKLMAIDEKLSADQSTRRGKIKDIGRPRCQ